MARGDDQLEVGGWGEGLGHHLVGSPHLAMETAATYGTLLFIKNSVLLDESREN